MAQSNHNPGSPTENYMTKYKDFSDPREIFGTLYDFINPNGEISIVFTNPQRQVRSFSPQQQLYIISAVAFVELDPYQAREAFARYFNRNDSVVTPRVVHEVATYIITQHMSLDRTTPQWVYWDVFIRKAGLPSSVHRVSPNFGHRLEFGNTLHAPPESYSAQPPRWTSFVRHTASSGPLHIRLASV